MYTPRDGGFAEATYGTGVLGESLRSVSLSETFSGTPRSELDETFATMSPHSVQAPEFFKTTICAHPKSPTTPKSSASPRRFTPRVPTVLTPQQQLRHWATAAVPPARDASPRPSPRRRPKSGSALRKEREQGFDNTVNSSAAYLPYQTVFDPHARQHVAMNSKLNSNLDKLLDRSRKELVRELVEMKRGRLSPHPSPRSASPVLLTRAASAPPVHRNRHAPNAMPWSPPTVDGSTLKRREHAIYSSAPGAFALPVPLQPVHSVPFAGVVRGTAVNLQGPGLNLGTRPHRAVFGPSSPTRVYHHTTAHHFAIGDNTTGVSQYSPPVPVVRTGDAMYWVQYIAPIHQAVMSRQ
eukprot:TRINITY_DN10948_c0_g1_i1.p1 TRINITY_DN10948_c0_g1~~TRINITY_DN10948_c0_g1_i1.p1  ORF type:complete len:352 (-),score=43.80 TRINITY_DN10948_c0_g1_i1:161-1216(-)